MSLVVYQAAVVCAGAVLAVLAAPSSSSRTSRCSGPR